PEVHNAIAASFAQTGRTELALSHVRRALATRPGFADAHLTLANILAVQDRLEEARTHFAEALKLDPSNPEARRGVAFLLFQAQDFAGAADAVRAALDGADADLLHVGAESARRLGRLDEAEALYRRLCAAAPRSADARRGLAGVFFERGALADAREAYQAVLAIDPTCAVARARLAAIDAPQGADR
ncbi:MAG: tetratricopeptide repeat protein, partial [Alphaproteobacteria bacterium]|nr:tetratricopeptide repeat protein [Alphaproteobacteria bacterium]